MTTTTQSFEVTGMTCGHCAEAVKRELSKISGVLDVQIALETGAVVVSSARPLDPAMLAEAVDEAGYAAVSL